MKFYNCPDCQRTDSCDGCPRTSKMPSNIINKINEEVQHTQFSRNAFIPNCCKNCSNHPSNGGSGYCSCTLPYFDESSPWRVTV